MPEHLLRAAKATAARRGITLTALVIESLAHTVRAERDNERQPAPDLQADQAWYEANRKTIEDR